MEGTEIERNCKRSKVLQKYVSTDQFKTFGTTTIREKVTKTYRKEPSDMGQGIYLEGKKITAKLKENKCSSVAKLFTFMTQKDHKENSSEDFV